jgi:hypothetical protein
MTSSTTYCAELIAKNATGTAEGGQVAFTTGVRSEEKGGGGGGTGGGGSSGSGGGTSSTSTSTAPPPPAPTGSASLAGSIVTVQSNGRAAAIKLTCTGNATCSGKVTLTAKVTTKKGKKKHTKTVVIGTATFSIPPGTTVTIKINLNATGRALLKASHGRLTASLTILKSSPSPSVTQTKSVHLVQQKATKKKHKK